MSFKAKIGTKEFECFSDPWIDDDTLDLVLPIINKERKNLLDVLNEIDPTQQITLTRKYEDTGASEEKQELKGYATISKVRTEHYKEQDGDIEVIVVTLSKPTIRSQIEKVAANVDYLAIMTDVNLEA